MTQPVPGLPKSPPRRRGPNRAAQRGALVGMVVGLVLFQAFGRLLFPVQPGEMNLNFILAGALAGAGSAAAGAWIGSLLTRPRQP